MPVILYILLGAVAVLAVLSIPVYFAARRPRRGTTEWMRCIETPRLPAPRACPLHPSDLGWLPLAVVLSAGLRTLLALFSMAVRGEAVTAFAALPSYALHILPACAILSAGTYLLVRLMSGGTLAAVCAATVLAVLQVESLPCAAATVWALVFLWLWLCAADDGRFALPALWLTLSLACFSAGLFQTAQLLWLAPLWIAAWIYVQIRRRSVGRAIASLLLTALLCSLCAVVVCGLRLLLDRYAGQGLAPVATAEFWRALPPVLEGNLRLLWPGHMGLTYFADGLLALAGGAALVCSLHGLIRRREIVCLMLLVLLPVFAALWLLGGQYLLGIPLVLALGWLWSLWSRREQTVFVILSVCILVMTDCVMLLI